MYKIRWSEAPPPSLNTQYVEDVKFNNALYSGWKLYVKRVDQKVSVNELYYLLFNLSYVVVFFLTYEYYEVYFFNMLVSNV